MFTSGILLLWLKIRAGQDHRPSRPNYALMIYEFWLKLCPLCFIFFKYAGPYADLPCKIWHGCACHFDVFTAKKEEHGIARQA